jgi:hypothetical protein
VAAAVAAEAAIAAEMLAADVAAVETLVVRCSSPGVQKRMFRTEWQRGATTPITNPNRRKQKGPSTLYFSPIWPFAFFRARIV